MVDGFVCSFCLRFGYVSILVCALYVESIRLNVHLIENNKITRTYSTSATQYDAFSPFILIFIGSHSNSHYFKREFHHLFTICSTFENVCVHVHYIYILYTIHNTHAQMNFYTHLMCAKSKRRDVSYHTGLCIVHTT